MKIFSKYLICLVLGILSPGVHAAIEVVDDIGQKIWLKSPAERVISLAPHATELLFASGATEQVVGTVSFSDFPEKAKKIQRIGSYNKFDLETIVAMKPDLIIAWESGNTLSRIDEVRKLGVPVYINEPRSFSDISSTIRKLGLLLGTVKVAQAEAELFDRKLIKLKNKYINKPTVSVFYQVWNKPVFTINGEHLISKVIELCGGKNIFSELSVLSPQIGTESVLQRNPEVIVAGISKGRENWLNEWKKWPGLRAVKNKNLYTIKADLIVRHTPRILLGTIDMCHILDKVRVKREKYK